jgi:hypothetical protein
MGSVLALLGVLLLAGGLLGTWTLSGLAGAQAACVFIAGAVLLGAGAVVGRLHFVVKELRRLREDTETALAPPPVEPIPTPMHPQDAGTSVAGNPIPTLRP